LLVFVVGVRIWFAVKEAMTGQKSKHRGYFCGGGGELEDFDFKARPVGESGHFNPG
jgi:hypothetical protein